MPAFLTIVDGLPAPGVCFQSLGSYDILLDDMETKFSLCVHVSVCLCTFM
jgi:hypothetical protein